MKYQVRNGCFETNSSASHALVLTVSNSGVYMTREEVRAEWHLDEDYAKESAKKKGKEVVLIWDYDNDYGRQFDVLYTFRDKLNYALAEYCGLCGSVKGCLDAIKYYEENIEPILLEIIGCDEIELYEEPMGFYIYSDVECTHLDEAEEVPYEKRKHMWDSDADTGFDCDGRPFEHALFDVPNFGSIDHQSVGTLRRFLEKNGLTLRDYLLRKDVIVLIDGDERRVFSRLKNCGLIDESNIVDATGRGELK